MRNRRWCHARPCSPLAQVQCDARNWATGLPHSSPEQRYDINEMREVLRSENYGIRHLARNRNDLPVHPRCVVVFCPFAIFGTQPKIDKLLVEAKRASQ